MQQLNEAKFREQQLMAKERELQAKTMTVTKNMALLSHDHAESGRITSITLITSSPHQPHNPNYPNNLIEQERQFREKILLDQLHELKSQTESTQKLIVTARKDKRAWEIAAAMRNDTQLRERELLEKEKALREQAQQQEQRAKAAQAALAEARGNKIDRLGATLGLNLALHEETVQALGRHRQGKDSALPSLFVPPAVVYVSSLEKKGEVRLSGPAPSARDELLSAPVPHDLLSLAGNSNKKRAGATAGSKLGDAFDKDKFKDVASLDKPKSFGAWSHQELEIKRANDQFEERRRALQQAEEVQEIARMRHELMITMHKLQNREFQSLPLVATDSTTTGDPPHALPSPSTSPASESLRKTLAESPAEAEERRLHVMQGAALLLRSLTATLGLAISEVGLEPREGDLAGPEGALVHDVKPGSSADVAGLRAGMLIIVMDGEPVHDAHDFALKFPDFTPGHSISVRAEFDLYTPAGMERTTKTFQLVVNSKELDAIDTAVLCRMNAGAVFVEDASLLAQITTRFKAAGGRLKKGAASPMHTSKETASPSQLSERRLNDRSVRRTQSPLKSERRTFSPSKYVDIDMRFLTLLSFGALSLLGFLDVIRVIRDGQQHRGMYFHT